MLSLLHDLTSSSLSVFISLAIKWRQPAHMQSCGHHINAALNASLESPLDSDSLPPSSLVADLPDHCTLWLNISIFLVSRVRFGDLASTYHLVQARHTIQTSLVAQMIENLPAMQETQVQSLGREDALEKGMATYSSILAWRVPWTEKVCELQSIELQRVRCDWATNTG